MSTIPAAGHKAPEFNLEASDGTTVSTDSLKGKKYVLYFYPKADTPGCTKETCGFRDALAGYKDLGVPVFGISPDPVKDVTKFAKKFDVNFPLLADTDHAIAEAYGVWGEKVFAGNKYMGVSRTTFVIDDGKIAKVFEKVKPEGHDQEVLTYLKA
ncbi:MAG: Thiol peroxidase, Bcp-type [Phycisphaerales bacterium]|nr:Thiol peroxidase, Bcp-type [Phycisphaerales bacterium]